MQLTRRRFLRAAGVTLALPWLDAFAPARASAPTARTPRRMVCICAPLGLHPPSFFPEQAGKAYPLTPYLEVLKEFRDDFTVISGLSHPDVGHSHDSIFSFLTAAPSYRKRPPIRPIWPSLTTKGAVPISSSSPRTLTASISRRGARMFSSSTGISGEFAVSGAASAGRRGAFPFRRKSPVPTAERGSVPTSSGSGRCSIPSSFPGRSASFVPATSSWWLEPPASCSRPPLSFMRRRDMALPLSRSTPKRRF